MESGRMIVALKMDLLQLLLKLTCEMLSQFPKVISYLTLLDFLLGFVKHILSVKEYFDSFQELDLCSLKLSNGDTYSIGGT